VSGWFRPATGSDDRTAIVLLHGMHQSADHWRAVGERLPDDRPVLAVDYRGHGGSERVGPHGVEEYAADVFSAMEAYATVPCHLVGTSFGGSVACAVAARHPGHVRSLLALSSARYTGRGRDVSEVVDAVRTLGVEGFFAFVTPRYTLQPGTPQKVVDEHVRSVSDGRDVDTVVAIFEGTYGTDIGPDAERVRCPGLVVSGLLDATCPPESGAELAAALGAEHVVRPDMGHVPAVECPTETAELIVEHVEQVEQMSRTAR
jgi:pimeloyl-ACP methyl ester carboxylesterase